MRIIDLAGAGRRAHERAAKLLVEEFHEVAPRAWPNRVVAREEVASMLKLPNLALAALDTHGRLVGWIGAIPLYHGGVWEIHPLVVAREHQGVGIGSALVREVEYLAHQAGVSTLWVGADDETGLTSLGGVDLYHNLPDHLARANKQRPHPMGFYTGLGFKIVGVLPDANGIGKPDIFFAKRVELSAEGRERVAGR